MTDMYLISNAESPVPICHFEEKTLAILNVSFLSTLFQYGSYYPISKELKLIL